MNGTMNSTRTGSILQRAPKILAVTAASYGLTQQPRNAAEQSGAGKRESASSTAAGDKQQPRR